MLPIDIEISGNSLEELSKAGEKLKQQLQTYEGLFDSEPLLLFSGKHGSLNYAKPSSGQVAWANCQSDLEGDKSGRPTTEKETSVCKETEMRSESNATATLRPDRKSLNALSGLRGARTRWSGSSSSREVP